MHKMNYLHDKRNQRKYRKYGIVAGIIGALALLFYISSVTHVFSSAALGIARPFWRLRDSFSEKIHSYRSHFASKKSLVQELDALKIENERLRIEVIDRDALSDENTKLKETLGRTKDRQVILGIALTHPGQSLYDTIIIDVGTREGIVVGAKVFAGGEALIGYVAEVFEGSSKAILYSAPGEKVEGIAAGIDTPLVLTGRGGGNFEIELPRDVNLPIGTPIVLPHINTYILGSVGDVTFDPRDPFQKVLVQSPVNVQEVRFVEIEKI